MKQTIFMPENHMDKLYNSKNFLVKFVHINRLVEIIKVIPNVKENLKVFDAGCGEGHLIELMHKIYKNYAYYGIDIIDVALKKSKERCTYAIIKKGNLTNTKFQDDFFDIIICTEVLEHIIEYKKVLKEFKRILKKDGILIITFPNEVLWTISRFFLGRKPVKVPDHYNSFNINKIKKDIDMDLVFKKNLPFGLPFFLSLNCIAKFKK